MFTQTLQELKKELETKQTLEIMQNGQAIGIVNILDDEIITSGMIGYNSYANFGQLLYGLQGFNICIDDIFIIN